MRVAIGTKAHSGWAALVVVGEGNGGYVIVDRRRIELVEEAWQKQPYHAAENLTPAVARDLVKRGVAVAHRITLSELRAAVKRERERKNDVIACAVLSGEPMPGWSVDEILSVHFRMHKAEGILFREALARATKACKLDLAAISEKHLMTEAEKALGVPSSEIAARIAELGKAVGPPWGKDQKDAALAAMIALKGHSID